VTIRGDRLEELASMTDRGDAKILEIFRCQARKDVRIDIVIAERRLVSFKT